MIFKLSIAFFVIIFFCRQVFASEPFNYKSAPERNIILVVTMDEGYTRDSAKMIFSSTKSIGLSRSDTSITQKLFERQAVWTYETMEVAYVYMSFLGKSYSNWKILAEPGDSIIVHVSNIGLTFSGRGSAKYVLQYDIFRLREGMKVPSSEPILVYPITFEQYFQWIDWIGQYENKSASLIDSYKNRIPKDVLLHIIDMRNSSVIGRLKDLFHRLFQLAKKGDFRKITRKDLCIIYDSTIAKRIEEYLPHHTDGYVGDADILKGKVSRKYSYEYGQEPLNSSLILKLLWYEEGLKTYQRKPRTREQFLARILTEDLLSYIGQSSKVQELFDKYYSEPGFAEYKSYVKSYELRRRTVTDGMKAPEFDLTDAYGKLFTSDRLKNKIVLADFWFTGCVGCVEMTPVLKRIQQEFKSDSNVVFLSVNTDRSKNQWLKSIEKGEYTTGQGIELYTSGKGNDHFLIKSLMIKSFPELHLLDNNYRIVENPLPDPRKDNGEYLISLISQKMGLLRDGPYLISTKKTATNYSINEGKLSSTRTEANFVVDANKKMKFTVNMKKKVTTEHSEFQRPERLFILSDIEGSFVSFAKLLQSNGVIDNAFHWMFKKGHLVISGDVFDRGEQVTECLWLIYSLEEQAKAAGGYVHFVLGNHEIMNLSGNHKYARQKYLENAVKIGRSYAKLYGTDTELGRWLRSKNIIEKIGDLLFVHGGISPELNNLFLSIRQINRIARPYLDRDSIAQVQNGKPVAIIYDTRNSWSPFWYRNYYQKEEVKTVLGRNGGYDTLYKTRVQEIDRTLKHFKVNKIITGHTIVKPGDTISVHYGDKVINTDVNHAGGKSEALLIEGNNFYRVNTEGKRVLLFTDNKRKFSDK